MRNGLKKSLWLTLALLAITQGLRAQSTTATISGTVTDESAAVLPNAQITAVNTATGVKRAVTTDAGGRYIISQLPPGTYDVSSSLTGFGTLVQRGITLTVSQQANLNLTMRVGSVSEQVTVTGEAPLVNTASGTVS